VEEEEEDGVNRIEVLYFGEWMIMIV